MRARLRLQQQEEHLRRTQKLEAVGTLAGGIAHDFNNVLTAIVGNTELGLAALPRDHPAAGSQRQVLKAAMRARDLVQQILAFSRRTESSRRPVAVETVVDETIGFLTSVTRGAVEYEHVRADRLPLIVADAGQVHQVLMNIGTNAVQAMRGRHGRLVFREEVVAAGAELPSPHPALKPGTYVRITIQDTGPGMTPEVLERIFEPFFTTKAPGEGSGLGLSVVHGIMQQHGGAVTVYSEPGRGTSFGLYFPIAPADAVPAEGADRDEPLARGAGELVLLVDDDRATLEPVRRVLEQLGYRVAAHHRPTEALADFQARPH
jgi:two-component system, cell cycle sensor histidine kinase and response regulator CckA